MNFFAISFPMGRFFGISVRIHITFFLYALVRITGAGKDQYLAEAVFLAGLYLSVLLHEFGHSLAARWCDGESNLIILWPLGGLAFCRPLFNPTAHLITAAAGPFVTFILFMIFLILHFAGMGTILQQPELAGFISNMMFINAALLIFNLIPAFPMDGGRILRDTLWHWMSVERATQIAGNISKFFAATGFIYGIFSGNYMLSVIAVFIFMQSSAERAFLQMEGPVQPFSIMERLHRKHPRPPSLPPAFLG